MNIDRIPCPDFYETTESCNGLTHFIDKSVNDPLSWSWDFGDGVHSIQQDPDHNYLSKGSYTVIENTCNSFGCRSISRNIVSTGNLSPLLPSCIPNSKGGCSGPFHITFGTIDKTSPSNYSYEDYSCDTVAILESGRRYPVSTYTGMSGNCNDFTIQGWIDVNNNGTFESNEIMFYSPTGYYSYHTSAFEIPSNPVLNRPLRMRMGATYSGTIIDPCGVLAGNVFEDYSVYIVRDSIKPIADFSFDIIDSCQGIVQFTDSSLNNPTRWHWDFGDGTTSNLQNPMHHYGNNILYNSINIIYVTLTVANANGTEEHVEIFRLPKFIEQPLLLAANTPVLCPGQTALLYAGNNYNAYSVSGWLLDSSVWVSSSLNHIYLDSAVSAQLVINNGFGCIDTTETFTITEAPAIPVSISSGLVCEGDTMTLYAPAGMNSYLWNTGDSAASIGVTNPGTYYVYCMVHPGCFASDSVSVTFELLPVSNISLVNDTLVGTPTGLSYQWYKDGILLPGITSNRYHPLSNGIYYALSTNASGCSAFSDSIIYLYTKVNDSPVKDLLQIYPNPITGDFYLRNNLNIQGKFIVRLLDIQGRILKEWRFNNFYKEQRLELKSSFYEGVYFIEINSERERVTIPVVIEY